MSAATRPTRLLLAIAGLAFAGFGAAFLVAPDRMGAYLDLVLDSTFARTDVRAVYGGVNLGVGLFLIACSLRRNHLRVGLGALILVLVGVLAGRLTGLIVDSPVRPAMWGFAGIEALFLLCALLAAWRLGRTRDAVSRP